MPAPNNPPFEAGALTQPRQLQRWLDCNKVNKLTRAETYLEIPVFSVEAEYKGYSDIVAVFNYEAGRNFSLKNLTPPVAPNYVACIAWLNTSGEVVRYKLWTHENERFYFPVEVYSKQRIFGNFRIEIWSVEPSEITALAYTGAGDADINTSYTQIQVDSWRDLPQVMQINKNGDYWYVENTGVGDPYFGISAENFPFGVWLDSIPGQTLVGTLPYPILSIAPSTYTQSSALTIYTTVRQSYDYRFVEDTLLVTADAVVTDFESTLDLPFVFPTDSVPLEN